MPSLLEILKDPNYTSANEETKRAIFERWAPQDTNYTGANAETQAAIRQRFGIAVPAAPAQPITPPGQIPGAPPGVVAPPAQQAQPSIVQRVLAARPTGSDVISFVRPTVEALGSAGGAIVGGTAGTFGAGPVGTVTGGVVGLGLGYGLAKGGLDVLEQMVGTRRAPASAQEALLGGARDVLTGATYETAGRVAAPIVSPAIQKFGTSATRVLDVIGRQTTRALDVKGRQATKIARAAAGKEIDAIRAALRGADPGDLPSQATANIDRKAWQSLNKLGASLDETDVILRQQSEDMLADLSRMARGGNATEIRNAIEESRRVLNDLTRLMRERELAAANQAAQTMARLGPQAAQRQQSMISALRQGQPMPAPAAPREIPVAGFAEPDQVLAGQLRQGAVPGTPLPGQSTVVPSVEAAERAAAAAQQLERVVPGEIPAVSARQAAQVQAAAANQWQETADVFTRLAGQRRVERDFLQRQIGSLEDYGLRPLNVDNVTAAIERTMAAPGKRMSAVHQQVLGRVREQLQAAAALNNGVIDARDLYTIRKEGVNEIIDTLMTGRDPKVSKKVAADVLSIVRPEIDNAIVRAGGTEWKQYLDTFSKGAKDLEKRQMAAEAFRLFKDSPEEYVKLVRGNNEAAVEAIFGKGNFDIFEEMGKEMSTLNKVASYVERQGIIANKATGGQQELVDIINANSWKRRLPNWFSPEITAINLALKNVESRLNSKSLKIIEKATLSNQSMLELLEGLPPNESKKLMRLVNGLSKAVNGLSEGVKTQGARAAAVATMSPEEQETQP